MTAPLRLSRRLASLAPSPTLAVDEKAKALQRNGVRILSFAAGEPDFDTPDAAKKAAAEALAAGFTKYCPAAGIPELRKAISRKLQRDNGLAYAPEEVLVTTGGKYAVYAAIQALVDPGDEVLIPAPYWVTYPAQVELAGGRPVVVPTREEDGFHLKADSVAAAVTERTRLLILCSPSNPTGAALSLSELEAIAEVCREKDLAVLSDEIYEKLLYEGEHVSIAGLPGMRERTVVASGAAKTYSMTGWRIGWLAAPAPVAKKIAAFLSQTTSNAVSFAQKGAVAAYLGCEDDVVRMRETFRARRDRMIAGLSSIEGFRVTKPEGAFYLFPNVEGAMRRAGCETSTAFAEFLLDAARVAAVPGEGFGAPGYMRFSYATSEEIIDEGVAAIRAALEAAG